LVAVEGKKFSELSWECVAVTKSIVEAFLVRRMIVAITDEQDGLLCKGVGEEERNVLRDLIHFVRSIPFHYIPFNLLRAALIP
jgi:hypothetical protein